jgi:ABC-type transport system involved in multi-copper enzyme maturation permease subunit
MAILTIARLTLREASRKRLLIALAVLTVIVAILSGWGFHRLLELPCGDAGQRRACTPTEIKVFAATLVVLLMFMFSFVLALGAAFVASPAIANDIESGLALAILPRPIRRSDVVLGKWLGLATLISLYTTFSCGMEFVIGRIAFGYVPPHPVAAIVFLIGESLVVLTLSMAWSTRVPAMTGGIIVLVLFGITWILGIAGSVGAALHAGGVRDVGTVSSLLFPTDGLWRGAIYNLEPVSLIVTQQGSRAAAGNPFFAPTAAPVAYVLWAIGWMIVVLGVAVWSFQRREL